jgi:hypothetical protein
MEQKMKKNKTALFPWELRGLPAAKGKKSKLNT